MRGDKNRQIDAESGEREGHSVHLEDDYTAAVVAGEGEERNPRALLLHSIIIREYYRRRGEDRERERAKERRGGGERRSLAAGVQLRVYTRSLGPAAALHIESLRHAAEVLSRAPTLVRATSCLNI